jgi:hypothetical protein
MKTFKNILNYKNLILPASIVSAFLLSFLVISPVIAGVKQGMDMHANCVKTVFPDNAKRDIAINSDEGIIFVGYEENGIRKEVTLSLKKDSKINDCTNSVKELITTAQSITNKIDTDTCKELNEIVSGIQPIPELDNGKKMDMVAANNYIHNRCQ